MRKNVGWIDRILRFGLALFLLWLGLLYMNGLQGEWLGILVALLALIPFSMTATGKCPVFKWFHVHSLSKKEKEQYGDPYPDNDKGHL